MNQRTLDPEQPLSGRFACERKGADRRRTSFPCFNSRICFRASRSSVFSAAVVPCLMPSSTSTCLYQLARQDSLMEEVDCDLPPLLARLANTVHAYDVVAELLGIGLGYGEVPSSCDSQSRGSDVPIVQESRNGFVQFNTDGSSTPELSAPACTPWDRGTPICAGVESARMRSLVTVATRSLGSTAVHSPGTG